MKTKKLIIKHAGKWLMGSLMLCAIALASCSNEEEMVQTTNGDKTPGTYTFRLGGAASGGAATRATVVAEDTEKQVNDLYVALFTADNKLYKVFGTGTGFDTGADDPATNVKIMKDADGNYTITPYYAGQYTAYFIANPGTELAKSIKALTQNNTLSDFEALAVTEDADQTTGSSFVMSSGRQIIEISSDLPTTAAEPIKLTRLAARFDIVDSQAGEGTSGQGAKITSVQLLQTASKSLIATPTDMPTGYVQDGEIKTWGTSSDKVTLYTYENINTGTADDNATVVRVKYQLEGATKQLDVTLKEEGVSLAVKRNNLYRINLNCAYGTYALEVIDWNTGETVNVHDGALDINYKSTDLGKIGDYVYRNNEGKIDFSDGGLRKMKLNGSLEWDTRPNPVADKGDCIGIVFSNMTSEDDKRAGFTNGYVMALKNTSTDFIKYGNENSVDANLPKITTLGAFIKDLDGYTYSQKLSEKSTEYPACKSAMEYGVELPAKTKTSGWYLPSIGQLNAIFYNLTELTNLRNSQSSTKDMVFGTYEVPFNSAKLALLNSMISPVGAGNYTPFSQDMNLISSTEVSKDYIAYVYIGANAAAAYKDKLVICGWGVKTFKAYIRPVFAF